MCYIAFFFFELTKFKTLSNNNIDSLTNILYQLENNRIILRRV